MPSLSPASASSTLPVTSFELSSLPDIRFGISLLVLICNAFDVCKYVVEYIIVIKILKLFIEWDNNRSYIILPCFKFSSVIALTLSILFGQLRSTSAPRVLVSIKEIDIFDIMIS